MPMPTHLVYQVKKDRAEVVEKATVKNVKPQKHVSLKNRIILPGLALFQACVLNNHKKLVLNSLKNLKKL